MRIGFPVLLMAVLSCARPSAANGQGFGVDIIVDGQTLPEHTARHARYIEALEGKEYAIRLRNPLGVRVAVALSVDGLNTIDARRSTAQQARKWVLDPHETVTISGWQTTSGEARRFYFTTEERSYAKWRGATHDLGVISAVVYRERPRVPMTSAPAPITAAPARERPAEPTRSERSDGGADMAGSAAKRPSPRDEYAATGIGREIEHRVEQVWMDLEPSPAAAVHLRYEFRAQLVALGVLPVVTTTTPLARRERARGFDRAYCPVPPR